MKGYRFDPSRLARPASELEREGYAIAGRMLRDQFGPGDIFIEVRDRVRRDPQLRMMLEHASALLAEAAADSPPVMGRLVRLRRRRV
jgi:hypothetical protein